MKVVFFEVEPEEKAYFKKNLKRDKLIFYKEELNRKNAGKVRDADIVCVFVYSEVDKSVISRFRKVKAVITRSTGFDHIDVEACKAKGIQVLNVPSYGENTVAEHAFGLILSLSKKIPESVQRVKKGDFSYEGLEGFDLKGKTIGIVGLGNIGTYVAKIARGFGMNILYFKRSRDKRLERILKCRYATLNNLMKKSDIVTLHLPYNKHTHHIINKNNIKLMKKSSYFINTARGGLVDTAALVRALSRKKIAGAGLDVLEEEEFLKGEEYLKRKFTKRERKIISKDHVLMKLDNVIITPHNAFNTKEALKRIVDTTMQDIRNVSKNKYPNSVLRK